MIKFLGFFSFIAGLVLLLYYIVVKIINILMELSTDYSNRNIVKEVNEVLITISDYSHLKKFKKLH